MKWMNNLSFLTKQSLIAVIYSVVILTFLWVSISSMNTLVNDTRMVSERLMPKLDFILQADRDLYQTQTAERTLVFLPQTHPTYDAAKQQHAENIDQAKNRMKKAAALTTDGAQKRLFQEFDTKLERWRQTTNRVVQIADSDWEAAKELSLNQADREFQSMRDVADKLTELSELEAKAWVEEAVETEESAILTTLTVAIIGGTAALIFAFVASKIIVAGINEVKDRVIDIAQGEGDLTYRIQIHGTDEVNQLGLAFNQFMENQSGLISHIKGAMTGLMSELEQVTEQLKKTQDATANQQAENDQIATAVTEMAATVQEVSRSANDAAQATQQANSDVENGRQVVESTVSGIEGLAGEIENSAQVIERVENGSHEIGTVMDVISSIAEQTNLLALNAAIEAARAGEQGRGFAVVADEVRTLAQRTQESTSSIRDIVERLQSESAAAVQAMTNSQSRASQVVETAGQTGAVLEKITSAVNAISDMNTQIATASEQQSSTADQISENGLRIKHIAEDNFEITLQVAEANDRVRNQAQEVSQLLSRFKVAD